MSHRIAPQPITRQKAPRIKKPSHLDFIRSLPCVVCGRASEAAHVRFADARYGTHTGMARKPHDAFTVPLCRTHHSEQHSMSEQAFWTRYAIDPHALALALHMVSGDQETGMMILHAWRAGFVTPIR